MSRKTVLMILDGWGHGDGSRADAIAQARTPFMDSLYKNYPHAELRTSGEDVGLPEGQMGNSEVGHLNIGAGRIVYQDLARINKAIREGELASNPVLLEAFRKAKTENRNLHFMGLCSDGGVHSHLNHLYALCDLAHKYELRNVFVHAFTDGRDCDPKSGKKFLQQLQQRLSSSAGKLVSVIGRYYAMDRDKRWERIREAYDLLVYGKAKLCDDMVAAVEESYAENITDEFIKPLALQGKDGKAEGRFQEDDIVICFNFRTDRCREITTVLTQQDMPDHGMKKMNLHYVTMTVYDESFKDVQVLFRKDNLVNTIGEVISAAGKKQIRIAETEKYPHVTFFFSGGREKEFNGEKRILIHSPKVATYDLQPEMSAEEVTRAIAGELAKEEADFICINYANPDMVGHTGVYEAIIKAVETIDSCVERVVTAGQYHGYGFVIIADHGNADFVVNADGSPNTAHTTNPVPIILIDDRYHKIEGGILADVAPTILALMNIPAPAEMTGKNLVA